MGFQQPKKVSFHKYIRKIASIFEYRVRIEMAQITPLD